MDEDPRALDELARRRFVADVPSELANLPLELRVVESDEVERATSWPSARSRRARCNPRNPAPLMAQTMGRGYSYCEASSTFSCAALRAERIAATMPTMTARIAKMISDESGTS